MKLLIAIACLGYASAQNMNNAIPDQIVIMEAIHDEFRPTGNGKYKIDDKDMLRPAPFGKDQLDIMPKPDIDRNMQQNYQEREERLKHQIRQKERLEHQKGDRPEHQKGDRPEHPRGDRPEHPRGDKPEHRMGNKHQNKDNKNIRNDPFQGPTDMIMVDDFGMPMPPPEFNHDHMKGDKHGDDKRRHKGGKRCFVFAITAIVFTIFGLLLGKCVRKCKKNKQCRGRGMKQVRNPVPINKTSSFIEEQVKEQEKKLEQLKNQLQMKKNQEARLAEQHRRTEQARRCYQQRAYGNYRQPQVQNRNNYGYYQQPQNGYYNQVPIGRPLNESANSSFAQEYPQL